MKRSACLVLLGLLISGPAGAGITDRRPGSAWLDENGAYPVVTKQIIGLGNGGFVLRQWVAASCGYLAGFELVDSATDRILLSTSFLQQWLLDGDRKLGHYSIPAGGAPEAAPRYEDIAGRGGIYFWDWRDNRWVVWSARAQDIKEGSLALPAAMPDFTDSRFQECFRWKYVLRDGLDCTEFVLELIRDIPAVRITVTSAFCRRAVLTGQLSFPTSRVAAPETVLSAAAKPYVLFLPDTEAAEEGLFLYVGASSATGPGVSVEGRNVTLRTTVGDEASRDVSFDIYVGRTENDFGKRSSVERLVKKFRDASPAVAAPVRFGPESGKEVFPVQVFFFGPPSSGRILTELSTVFNRFLIPADLLPRYADIAASRGARITAGISWNFLGGPESLNQPVFRENAGRYVRNCAARLRKEYPLVAMLDLESEAGNALLTDPFTLARLRKELGISVFPERNWKPGLVPESDPYLRMMSWWIRGGGLPGFLGELGTTIGRTAPEMVCSHSEGFMSAASNGLYAPTLWEKQNVLFKWTYTYPDPKLAGFAAECLKSAARPGQKICPNIQLLWKKGWLDPERHYTINADILREATWLVMSRGVDMISYWPHFFLVEGSSFREQNAETVTCPRELWEAMQRLNRELFLPYGTLCARLEKVPPQVGLFYSFTEELATGWKHQKDAAESWYELGRAHIPSDIVYEETLEPGVPARYQVLVLPDLSFMRGRTAEALRAFIKRGGLVIAEKPLPFLSDSLIVPEDGTITASWLKKRLCQNGPVRLFADTPVEDVVINRLKDGDAQYLFLVNDRRRFGSWVGKFRVYREEGVGQTVPLVIESGGRFEIEDLLRRRELVPDDRGRIQVELGPAAGTILKLTPKGKKE